MRAAAPGEPPQRNFADGELPVFTFMRTDTHTQEIIAPPSFSSADSYKKGPFSRDTTTRRSRTVVLQRRGAGDLSRGTRSPSTSSQSSGKTKRAPNEYRSACTCAGATFIPNVPADLPEIAPGGGRGRRARRKSRCGRRGLRFWRMKNGQERSRPVTPVRDHGRC